MPLHLASLHAKSKVDRARCSSMCQATVYFLYFCPASSHHDSFQPTPLIHTSCCLTFSCSSHLTHLAQQKDRLPWLAQKAAAAFHYLWLRLHEPTSGSRLSGQALCVWHLSVALVDCGCDGVRGSAAAGAHPVGVFQDGGVCCDTLCVWCCCSYL